MTRLFGRALRAVRRSQSVMSSVWIGVGGIAVMGGNLLLAVTRYGGCPGIPGPVVIRLGSLPTVLCTLPWFSCCCGAFGNPVFW